MRGRFDAVAALMVAFWVAVVAAVVGLIGFMVYEQTKTGEQICTVEKKERIYAGKDSGVQQRVYTEDCGVFDVGDSLFDGHFTSADTWAAIEEGGTYRLKTRGVRFGFLSMFPNIVEVEEVEK